MFVKPGMLAGWDFMPYCGTNWVENTLVKDANLDHTKICEGKKYIELEEQ